MAHPNILRSEQAPCLPFSEVNHIQIAVIVPKAKWSYPLLRKQSAPSNCETERKKERKNEPFDSGGAQVPTWLHSVLSRSHKRAGFQGIKKCRQCLDWECQNTLEIIFLRTLKGHSPKLIPAGCGVYPRLETVGPAEKGARERLISVRPGASTSLP